MNATKKSRRLSTPRKSPQRARGGEGEGLTVTSRQQQPSDLLETPYRKYCTRYQMPGMPVPPL